MIYNNINSSNNMSKLSVLVITNGNENSSVNHFRLFQQHKYMSKYMFEDININFISLSDLPIDDGADYNYDMIYIHATLTSIKELMDKLYEQRSKHKLKLIIDIDDYWVIPAHNPAFKAYKELQVEIPKALQRADGVTTTTKRFADEIKKYNKNVIVLENCIEDEFITKTKEYDGKRKLRVGFIGGSTHLNDLQLFKGVVKELEPLRDRLQFVLCGFDTTAQGKSINKQMTCLWNDFEQVFTNDYKTIDEDYLRWLLQYNKDEWYDINNEYYKRVWSKPIDKYHELFNEVDVLIAPLQNDNFNNCKSELKIIEAGTHGKVIICSKVGSYMDGFKHSDDVLFVNNVCAKQDFVKNIKFLLNEPYRFKEIADKLQTKIRNKYNINRICKKRLDFYKKMCQK